MPLYLTVSTGPRADNARPIMAISDQHLIATLLREIGRLAEPGPYVQSMPTKQKREPEQSHAGVKEGMR